MQFSSIFKSRCVQRLYTYTILIFSLSESPWSEYARAEWTCLSLLTCQRRFSLFSCSHNVKNAHFSAWLETPLCHMVLYPFPIFSFQRRLSVWRSITSIFLQSGSFTEVRMADTSKCNYPGACRIVDAYFRLNLSGWVWFYCSVFNVFAISHV